MRLRIGMIGLGAAGSALAAELWLQGCRDMRGFDSDLPVRDAIAEAGGIRFDGFLGRGVVPMPLEASAAAAAEGMDVVLVSVTADRHAEVATALAPALAARQVVFLHTGYVGGGRVFAQALEQAGAGLPILVEAINSVHLSGTVSPGQVFIKGRKRWLETTAYDPGQTLAALAVLAPAIAGLAAGRNALETGLNNPNPIGHAPALIGNLGLLDRRLGDVTDGVLYFDELRSPSVQRVCDAFERERISVIAALGFQPLPVAEFSRRAYPPGARYEGEIPRFGTKLLPRFLAEDLPAALVPLEEFGARQGVATPTISALLTLAATATGRDFRATGRTIASLGEAWVAAQPKVA